VAEAFRRYPWPGNVRELRNVIERAMFIVSERNPSLSPALNHTRIGAWTRLSRIALYRLRPADFVSVLNQLKHAPSSGSSFPQAALSC
jgi:DNA-binding NtrC family response regulator